MTNKIMGTNKATEVKNHLRQKILKGVYPANEKLPSIRQLSDEYNLNKTTINMAITGLVSEKLLTVEPGRGTFVVDREASGKSKQITIGHIIFDGALTYPSIMSYIKHATGECDMLKWNLIPFYYPKEGIVRGASYLKELILDRNISGLLVTDFMKTEDIVFLEEHGIPFVYVGVDPNPPGTYGVVTDDFAIGFTLTEHLLNLGHKRIALLLGPAEHFTSELILLGYKSALLKKGISYDESIVKNGEWGDKTGYRLTGELLGLKDRPTAVINAEEIMAVGTMRRIMERGLSVPEDIAVVGNGDRIALYSYPVELTTMDFKTGEQVKTAVEMLHGLLEGEPVPMKKKITPELVVRDSCGARRKQ